ncbi:MAG: M48 family metalloprotease [Nitrospinota bacterium]
MIKNIPRLFLLTISLLFHSGCFPEQYICQTSQSPSCKKAVTIWQADIDYVVKMNFPQDYGKYRAVVWEGEFDNAWVTKGREINIYRRFLEKLNPIRRICVAAHEISHLKMGHYYSRIGIIIVNPDSNLKNFPAPSSSGNGESHYGAFPSIDVPLGFGINQEVEADRMAVKLITRLGLNKNHYLDLLLYLQGRKVNKDSLLYHRIVMMRKL